MFLPIIAITICVVSLIFALGVALLDQYLVLGVGIVLFTFFCESLAISLPGFNIGLTIYPQDIVFTALILAGITRFFVQNKFNAVNLSWLFFGLLLFGSFTLGAINYGITSAGVEFRSYFYFWSGTFYFMSFSYQTISRVRWFELWLLTSFSLLIIAIVRWITDSLGISTWGIIVGVTPFRVLNASQAFFIAETFSILLFQGVLQRLTRRQLICLIAFAPAILLLQHRTVWVTTIASVALIFIRERKSRNRLITMLLSIIVIGSIWSLVIFSEQMDLVWSSLDKSYSSAVANQDGQGTFFWRVEGWKALLADFNSPVNYLLGQPFGFGYQRIVGNQTIDVSPHNYFVQTYLRVGLIGLINLCFIYAIVLFNLFNKKINNYYNKQIFIEKILWLVIVMQIIYFIPYSPSYEQAIILGFALSYTKTYLGNKALLGNLKSKEDEHSSFNDLSQPTRKNVILPRKTI